MKLRNIFITSILCFLFILPNPAKSQSGYQPDVKALISRLPATDATEAHLIFSALLQKADGTAIDTLCLFLASNDSAKVLQAKLALSGLAKYVSEPNHQGEKRLFTNRICRALQNHSPWETKTFLIRQLQWAGSSEAVPTLVNLLKEPLLQKPALAALAALAPKNLLNHLKSIYVTAEPQLQADILKTLAELKVEEAEDLFWNSALKKNGQLQTAGFYGLAQLGLPRAHSLFRQSLSQLKGKKRFTRLNQYLRYLENLAANGYNELAERETLWFFRSVQATNLKIAALTLLGQFNSQEAGSELISALSSQNRELAAAAADIVTERLQTEIIAQLPALWPRLLPETKALLLQNLRFTEGEFPQTIFNDAIADSNAIVRHAAWRAALRYNPAGYLPRIFDVLKAPDSGQDVPYLVSLLNEQQTKAVENGINKNFFKFNPRAQLLILNAVAKRELSVKRDIWRKHLAHPKPEFRKAALKVAAILATDREINVLLSALKRNKRPPEQRQLQRAIANVINRSQKPEKVFQKLTKSFSRASVEQQKLLLPIFSDIKMTEATSFLTGMLRNSGLHDAAVRALCDCNNLSVLPVLRSLAASDSSSNVRILAFRACLRLIRNSELSPAEKLQRLKRLWLINSRLSEKKQLMAVVSTVHTTSALEFALKGLRNDSLKVEAASAALTIAKALDKQSGNGDQSQAILNTIHAIGDEELSRKIDAQFPEISGLNRPPAGFTALFNGRDLTGWKGLVGDPVKRRTMSPEQLTAAQDQADRDMRLHWRVEDGILIFDGKGHSLCTNKDYEDFELFVDWKIQRGGDSGIYLRGSPQVQIWDPAQWPEGSGGLYNNKIHPSKPLVCADNPVGEWNTFHIKMIGDRVTVYLNGVLVVDNVIMENYWERDKPIYPSGQIELQAHNTPLYFRNIFIREIPRKKDGFAGPLLLQNSLKGWEQIGGQPNSWQVKDGILTTNGKGGGWLSTTREFSDFQLDLEFRVSPGGNSGVFIRAPHRGDPAYTGMEIQILDDYAEQYQNLKPWQYTGSVYGVKAPEQRASKPAGTWQKMTIICKGPKVKVILNNAQIIDINVIDFMHLETTHPGLKNRRGFIGLQCHSGIVEFRRILIKEL